MLKKSLVLNKFLKVGGKIKLKIMLSFAKFPHSEAERKFGQRAAKRELYGVLR
jgi:hypothetical protein